MIAGCNDIVADQLTYTPEADLTDFSVMGIRLYVLPASMIEKKLDYPRLESHRYILNGLDDEDRVYDIIKNMY